MINKSIKIAACVFSVIMAVSGSTLHTEASALSGTLPVAGAALTLNEGSSFDVVKREVKEKEEAMVDVELNVGADAGVNLAAKETAQTGAAAAAASADEFSNLAIAKVNDYVNVRSEPSEEGEIIGKLYDKSVGEFIAEADGGWYQIQSGSVTGYVKAEYVVTGDAAKELAPEVGKRIAKSNTMTLFARENSSTDSSVIGMIEEGGELTVLEEGVTDGWVKVSVEEGEGYVSTDFVSLSTEFVRAESKAEEEARIEKEQASVRAANAAADKKSGKKSNNSGGVKAVGGSGRGSSVAGFATQFVGNPYVYGGTSLTNGADCSGFVMSVYANFGVSLPHSSGALRGVGANVGGLGNAQPGDIVCYSGHVGIYIGGGQIVHASTAATGIKISNAGYKQVLSVRRIF